MLAAIRITGEFVSNCHSIIPGLLWVVVCLLLTPAASHAVNLADAQRLLPGVTTISPVAAVPALHVANGPAGSKVLLFQTDDFVNIPAYSGSSINLLVALTSDGKFAGIDLLSHQEPILVVGITDNHLKAFVDQLVGKHSTDRIRVGARNREGYVGIDGLSGATITAMVITRTVTLAAERALAAYAAETATAPLVQDAPPETTTAVAAEPDWYWSWEQHKLQVIVLGAALTVLLLVLFLQDWLVKRKLFFQRFRVAWMLFTVIFIGWICHAQLSVVNLLGFARNLAGGFSWESLLLDPVVFLLWAFVALSILLWGRGVYCGWLCPFGAAQELLSKLSRSCGLAGWQIPHALHERLWAIKYLLLIAICGLALDSMANAARLAEVEPFKTVFVMQFQRPPAFVFYALALLALTVLNSKFYCKYLCPLGAALSFVTRFKVFDWLRRRVECGHPCQTCAHDCQIGAIKPTGEIIDNECHYCLDCQVTYWDEHRCPPMVRKRKRRQQHRPVADTDTDAVIASDSQ
ncbi:4Fe-4S binding protein [Pseudohalioglobus lutimaris]|uniref:4Fe-4S binding protein n=1 Tax=Pseudohalioglobus lutimaris TaxID=1737061 RepID=A0A2N5X295_9GAMM|nr:4Fe-4S binding protein [Pseudohalioglobus lutimaris]PLW68598.1 4Fe-4S binding protein [Pseudohalioglobus lutimaris]